MRDNVVFPHTQADDLAACVVQPRGDNGIGWWQDIMTARATFRRTRTSRTTHSSHGHWALFCPAVARGLCQGTCV